MQKDLKSMDDKKIMIKSPIQPYPGICNLCTSKQHSTIDCPFSIVLYHATNLESLKSIVQNGFNLKKGRLGKALYCSDDPSMCVRFVLKNLKKFSDPVLIKIKAMVTNCKTLNSSQQVKNVTRKEFQEQGIDCIKCPYFKVNDKILYEFAIYDINRQNSTLYNSNASNKNYSIVSWSRIKLPQSLNRETSKIKQQNISDQQNISNHIVQDCTIQTNEQQEKRKLKIAKKIQSVNRIQAKEKQFNSFYDSIFNKTMKMDQQKQSNSIQRVQNVNHEEKQHLYISFPKTQDSTSENDDEDEKQQQQKDNHKKKKIQKKNKKESKIKTPKKIIITSTSA